MKQHPEIEQELKDLGSTLAGVEPVNIFRVPEGYFNSIVHDVLLEVSPTKAIPEGSVPEGYFEGLASAIIEKINQEETADLENIALLPELKNMNRTPVFSLPAAYFDELPEIINSRIKEDALQPFLSENLVFIRNINPYQVPAGYFEHLPKSIIEKVNIGSAAPVIQMSSRRSLFRYTAAAVMAGLLGLAIFSTFNDGRNKQLVADNLDESTMRAAKTIVQKGDFDAVLSSVSDQEIVDYLSNGGEDVNAALVASVAASDNLPDQIDYILDDHTLDNLLDGVITN